MPFRLEQAVTLPVSSGPFLAEFYPAKQPNHKAFLGSRTHPLRRLSGLVAALA